MSCKETQERITNEILFYMQTFQQMPYKSLSFKGVLELFLIRDNDVRMQQVFRNIWNELAISNIFHCAWLCVWMSERVCISVCHRSDCWCKLCNVLWPMRTLTTHSILRQMEPNGKFREQYWLWHNTNTNTIFTYKHTHTHTCHTLTWCPSQDAISTLNIDMQYFHNTYNYIGNSVVSMCVGV